jgi:hypothetical protein
MEHCRVQEGDDIADNIVIGDIGKFQALGIISRVGIYVYFSSPTACGAVYSGLSLHPDLGVEAAEPAR